MKEKKYLYNKYAALNITRTNKRTKDKRKEINILWLLQVHNYFYQQNQKEKYKNHLQK